MSEAKTPAGDRPKACPTLRVLGVLRGELDCLIGKSYAKKSILKVSSTESGKRKTLIKSIFICLLFNNKTLFSGLKLRVLRASVVKK
jgi:hypothetical protein